MLLLNEPGCSLDTTTVGWLANTVVQTEKSVLVSTHKLSMAAEL